MESKGWTGPRDTQKIKTKGCDCTGHLRGVERRQESQRAKREAGSGKKHQQRVCSTLHMLNQNFRDIQGEMTKKNKNNNHTEMYDKFEGG